MAATRSHSQENRDLTRIRVSGELDMIRLSNRLFEVLLADGQRVRAVWTQSDVLDLKEFLSRKVVIEGRAIYHPSGSLLRIDAEAIAPAAENDALFSTIPQPPRETLEMKQLRSPQSRSTGINAIWGAWEGEETDQDLLQALEEIR